MDPTVIEPDATTDPEPVARWSLRAAITSRDGYLALLVLAVVQLGIWLLAQQGEVILHVIAYWLLLLTLITAMHRAHVHALAFRIAAFALLLIGAAWSTFALMTGEISDTGDSVSLGISTVLYAALLALPSHFWGAMTTQLQS